MFTDMVGYTALGQRDESLSLALVEEQRRLVRPILARHGGREVKTIGDAFLVEFPNALDAVRCSYEIQRSVREFNIPLSAEKRLHLRIGVHVGDVVESHGDISGDAVNVASRIEPLAEDGGVCLTRQVYDHVHNKFELPLESLGSRPLKNVSAPVEVFRMAMPWKESVSNPQPADRMRLAVLPFASLSPDPNDEYFADGLTEELITKLSEIQGLRVIARTSVMNYKRKEKGVSEIGRELAVGSVMEGSVRKAGSRVRITAQLIETQSEEHLWASTYDRELDDIFAIQSEVAAKVAGSLRGGVLAAPQRKDTTDLNAYMYYMKAVQLIHDSTEPSLREALALLERCVANDPGFVRAYSAITLAWSRMITGGYEDFTAGVAHCEEAARKALQIGPEWAESHAAMAGVHSFQDRFDDALVEAEKAVAINPNLAEAHLEIGAMHTTFGRISEAIASYERAHELDPLQFAAASHLAMAYRSAGRVGDALEVLGKMKEMNPKNPRIYASLAECYMTKGEFGAAQDMLDLGNAINPEETFVRLDQGVLNALKGDRQGALEEMKRLDMSKTEAPRLYGHLFISAALGDVDECFRALTRQAEIHSWPYNVEVHPLLADVRKDPRYADFRRRVGISG
jgi:adenylate cyclase